MLNLQPNYEALKQYCNLWRNWGDIDDSYQSLNGITDYFATNAARIAPHAGQGHWNDPDMVGKMLQSIPFQMKKKKFRYVFQLIIGNYGLSIDQSKTQMAIWAILAAPLLMSVDLKNIRPEFQEILLNQPIIDVNQDELGFQGWRAQLENQIEVFKIFGDILLN